MDINCCMCFVDQKGRIVAPQIILQLWTTVNITVAGKSIIHVYISTPLSKVCTIIIHTGSKHGHCCLCFVEQKGATPNNTPTLDNSEHNCGWQGLFMYAYPPKVCTIIIHIATSS